MLALGIAAAVAASLLYNASIALQALEAREVAAEHSLRPSLMGRLVRNRRWLGATALGLAGWPLEIAALLLAPLTVVQPCLASGLLLLLWLGAKRLGERPGQREWIAVTAIVLGVLGVALARPNAPLTTPAPERSRWRWPSLPSRLPLPTPAGGSTAVGTLAVVSAGCGYAWTAIASKLLTDELAAGALLVAVAWLATAAASEGLALLSEMSALQRRPATHVAPVMFAVQILVPVLLAPLIFGESWAGPRLGAFFGGSMAVAVGGTVLLAGSRAVGAVIENAREQA